MDQLKGLQPAQQVLGWNTLGKLCWAWSLVEHDRHHQALIIIRPWSHLKIKMHNFFCFGIDYTFSLITVLVLGHLKWFQGFIVPFKGFLIAKWIYYKYDRLIVSKDTFSMRLRYRQPHYKGQQRWGRDKNWTELKWYNKRFRSSTCQKVRNTHDTYKNTILLHKTRHDG